LCAFFRVGWSGAFVPLWLLHILILIIYPYLAVRIQPKNEASQAFNAIYKLEASAVSLELLDNQSIRRRLLMPIEHGSCCSNYTLEQLSPKDKKFSTHKSVSAEVARLYQLDTGTGYLGFLSGRRIISFEKFGIKIADCGGWLKFVYDKGRLYLVDARFCKVPHCPMCQWRRELKWRAKFLAILPEICSLYPTRRWVFLTLTIRNCDLQDLRATLKRLNEAFNRLVKLKGFPMDGFVKSVEVTRAWDCYHRGNYLGRHGTKWIAGWEARNKERLELRPTNEVHPHLHICGLVPAGYFSKSYIKHEQWVEMWRHSLRIDYDPMVNIQAVKSKKSKSLILPTPEQFIENPLSDDTGMIQAICETLKYTVKEKDLIGVYCQDDKTNSEWLKLVTEQLYKTRKVEYRGILKEVGKELEEAYNSDNLEKINEDEEIPKDVNLKELTFRWIDSLENYILRSDYVSA
jgi:plasmid rolling circle replication initiator protein Rep